MDKAERVCADLAQRVIELRKERGWSQEYLAERAQIDTRNLRRIEATGDARVSTVAQIADGLDVTMSDLFTPPSAQHKRSAGRPRVRDKPGK